MDVGLHSHQTRNTPSDRTVQARGQAGLFLWEPEMPKTPTYPGFSRFWDAWPASLRKVNRSGCTAVWRSQNLEEVAEQVLAGLERWKKSGDWDDPKWVPMPKTWLAQRRWEGQQKPEQPKLQSGAW